MGRKSKVPWTEDSVNLLIMIYERNIDNFMSEYTPQTALWKKLVELMKKKHPELQESLTFVNAQGKWNSLIRKFKSIFYQGFMPSEEYYTLVDFPFYPKMFKIFTDYAAKKLNMQLNDTTLNESLDENISVYVMNLLNGKFGEDPIEKENDEPEETVSRADKIVEKINAMPKSSVNVFQTTMRIEKNTPFKRTYGISTICDQRNAINKELKRESDSQEAWPHKIKIRKVSKASPAQSDSDSFEYQVEALDECSFIQNKYSSVDYKNVQKFSDGSQSDVSTSDSSEPLYVSNSENEDTLIEVSDSSDVSSSSFQKIVPGNRQLPKTITMRKVEPQSSDASMKILKGITVIKQKSMNSLSTQDLSILEVPSLNESFDGLRAQSTPRPQPSYPLDITARRSANTLVPKKLVYEAETSHLAPLDVPPSWFRDFMKKYNEDIKRIDARLEKIDRRLTSILQQKITPNKVLVSPQVTRIKRGY